MVRIIETDCTVNYDGRGSTFRDRGVRLLIIKDDKSFLVHRSTGVKPLNYMTKTIGINEDTVNGLKTLTVESRTEVITVTMYEVFMDITIPMKTDASKSVIVGTEAQLQAWMTSPQNWSKAFGDDRCFLAREVDVTNGAVDLMGIRRDGSALVVIEMKRHAKRNDAFQVERYREALNMIGSDSDAFLKLKRQLTEKAIACGVSSDILGLIDGLQPDAVTDPECWLVASDAAEDVDEFAAQHDIRLVTVGDEWVNESLPVDIARKSSSTEVEPEHCHVTQSILDMARHGES